MPTVFTIWGVANEFAKINNMASKKGQCRKKYDREMQFITRTARACNAGMKITKMLCVKENTIKWVCNF